MVPTGHRRGEPTIGQIVVGAVGRDTHPSAWPAQFHIAHWNTQSLPGGATIQRTVC